MPSPVWSCNEWDPLEEVIIGTPLRAMYPPADLSTQAIQFYDRELDQIPVGPFPQRAIDETVEDVEALIEALVKLGITVRRPETWPHDRPFATPTWQSTGMHNFCPRDVLTVIGDTVIESANAMRCRLMETLSYKRILVDYLRRGARWIAAPRPALDDDTYQVEDTSGLTLLDHEPVFDAANLLRAGRDVFYQVSSTGNELGGQWLQQALGPQFRVHFVRGVYLRSHLDSTFSALRPGLLLCNPARVNQHNLPAPFKKWDVIDAPEMVDDVFFGPEHASRAFASPWVGMNVLSLGPDLVVVNASQAPLIRLLERRGLNVLPIRLRHGRLMGGGFHCLSVDVRRRGPLESYFD